MQTTEPFPFSADFDPEEPVYLAQAPLWFREWRKQEFVPLTVKVSTQLTIKRVGLELGKLGLYGGGTLLLTRFPELKSTLGPLLVQLFGGG